MDVEKVLSPERQRAIAKIIEDDWMARWPNSGGVRVHFDTVFSANNWHIRSRLEPIEPFPPEGWVDRDEQS